MSADGRPHILAMGGSSEGSAAGLPPALRLALSLTGRSAPAVCLLPTANEPNSGWLLDAYRRLAEAGAVPSHITLFPQPNVADPAELLLSQDLVFVGGGSVANLAALWRVHGLDSALGRAWERGVVLAGTSAGAICWFEGGTTDSFGPTLRAFRDGLGLLAGSFSPHYGQEPQRRPAFQRMVARGSCPGG